MLYVIKDTKNGLYYLRRMDWVTELDDAEHFQQQETAESHIELLPDRHTPEDMKIIPVTVVPVKAVAKLARAFE